MLFAIMMVIFWKTVLKIIFTVAAMVIIVLLTAGAVALLQDLHL